MPANKPKGKPRKVAPHTSPCRGPVSDLEAQVPADWWRTLFNATYLKTDADVVGDPDLDAQEVAVYCRLLACSQQEKILDLCCGQGRHCLQMARLGFRHLYGYDRSRYLIGRARRQARKAGLSVVFKEGDARKLTFTDQSFAAVMLLGNSFGYFDSAHQDGQLLKEVRRVLRPGGRLLLDLTDGGYLRNHFQPRSWEWLDASQLVCRERALSADGQRLICREILLHTSQGVQVDQFYAERLYNGESLRQLLLQAGLAQVSLHGHLPTAAGGSQDPGMMERRLLVTAHLQAEPLSQEAGQQQPAQLSDAW